MQSSNARDTHMKPNDKYKSPAYWTQLIQLKLFDAVRQYLDDNNMSRKDFADKLGVTKGYITQIMNGDFDHKLSKLSELALACDLVPKFEFVPACFANIVARDSYLQPSDWKSYSTFSGCQTKVYERINIAASDTIKPEKITLDSATCSTDQDEWQTIDHTIKIAG